MAAGSCCGSWARMSAITDSASAAILGMRSLPAEKVLPTISLKPAGVGSRPARHSAAT